MSVTIKTTLRKFDGEGDAGDPVEVIESEETVPLSSLSPEMQAALLAGRED